VISAGPFYWIAEFLGQRVPPSSISGCDFVSTKRMVLQRMPAGAQALLLLKGGWKSKPPG